VPSYAERLFGALGRFNADLAAFTSLVQRRAPDPPRIPRKELDGLLALSTRAGEAANAIGISLGHIVGQRGVDLVDMQVRLKSETARLAGALSGLGEQVQRQHFIREAFAEPLVALDEASHLVAAAVFPSAVDGLRAVNVRLWDFQRIEVVHYGRILETVVREKRLTADQQARIEQIGLRVRQDFETINDLLNELAEGRATDGKGLRTRIDRACTNLEESLADAARKVTTDLKRFKTVIDSSARIARDVIKGLRKIVVPIFPTHDRLGSVASCIDADLYDSLSGVQAFALLNITARLQSTLAAGKPLLTSAYGIRVTEVYPDRIYFEAARDLIDAAASEATFESAPASLHKFKEGSLKQQSFRKGNLQMSFATVAPGRVMVDADLDLYRATIPHLFGEVLVNHLTDSRTNQFRVREILDEQGITPVGGFGVLTA
jgi:hypothetical protein